MKPPLIAVVLAAGSGTRFFPFTTSKTLFPFFGKPLFDYSVLNFLPPEVDRVVIISNTANQKALQSISLPKPTTIVIQREPLGMADALLSASGELKDARLLVVIADDVVGVSASKDVMKLAANPDVFGVLPGYHAKEYFPGGYFKMDGDRILGIIEKPRKEDVPSPYVAISGQYFRDGNAFLAELRVATSDADDVYERSITTLALRQKLVVSPYDGLFASLKYPWQVLDVMEMLFETGLGSVKSRSPKTKANVVIEGNVVFGVNVRIFENTKIVGPCYIGDNTIIGNNNIIRGSMIGANCVTGFNTDITRSYVGDGCWFHSNYIGDSVLEGNVSMGSGAVLANLRLDDGEIFSSVKGVRVGTARKKLGGMIGAGVRIGVNASIMPGVKIGTSSFIGSGVVLDRDVAQGSFVSLQNNAYTVGENSATGTTASREEFKSRLG